MLVDPTDRVSLCCAVHLAVRIMEYNTNANDKSSTRHQATLQLLTVCVVALANVAYCWTTTWMYYLKLPIGSSFRDTRLDVFGMQLVCLVPELIVTIRLATARQMAHCLFSIGIAAIGAELSLIGTVQIAGYLVAARKLVPLP